MLAENTQGHLSGKVALAMIDKPYHFRPQTALCAIVFAALRARRANGVHLHYGK